MVGAAGTGLEEAAAAGHPAGKARLGQPRGDQEAVAVQVLWAAGGEPGSPPPPSARCSGSAAHPLARPLVVPGCTASQTEPAAILL